MTFKLPTLYKLTSKGKVQTWEQEVDGCVITTTHGQQDGKKQVNSETIYEGKNIGKANATTPAQQAKAEAESRWRKKQDRQGYTMSIDNLGTVKDDGGPVMLAHKYAEHADKMPEVCYSQPKLDGHRCKAVVVDGVCTLYSRTNGVITGVPHINAALATRFQNVVLDGELYNHEYRTKFEELTSFIRQESPKAGHEVVQYHIYDVIISPDFDGRQAPFAKRFAYLEANESLFTDPLILGYTSYVDTAEQVEDNFRAALAQGYEGIMLRNPESVYKNGRSHGLLKVKEMDDAEFKVTGVSEGRGKMQGAAILRCQIDENNTFECKMKGSFDNLKYMFSHPEQFIGRMLTVQYQGKTKYGVPRFPVGLRFRDDI